MTVTCLLYIFALFCCLWSSCCIAVEPGSICCVPDQFEATLFYDNANVFQDANTAYSYINATVIAAYDYTNRRVFLNVSTVELSPLVPQPVGGRTLFLLDYSKGIQYQVTGSDCQKDEIDNMTRQCIPDTAQKVGGGIIGNGKVHLETYVYKRSDTEYMTYTATVDPQSCIPSTLVYIGGSVESDSGTINNILVSDLTTGIKNSSVFDIPSQCLHSDDTGKTKNEDRKWQLFERLFKFF